MLETLHAERLSQGVVDRVLAAIRAGELKPGDRLPSERQLAEELGVSRPSVREGLRVLELLEAIDVRQGRSAVVLPDAHRPTGRYLRRWLDSHTDEVIELLEVREALEALAAARAATRPGPEVRPERPAEPDLDAIVKADVRFHELVAHRSGNGVLASLVDQLNAFLETSRYAMFAMEGRAERSHRDHLRIARAIDEGRADDAAAAMRTHIADTRREIEMNAEGQR